MKLLILHHYSTNIGDRGVLYAILRELARLGISKATVSASSPESFPQLDVPSGIELELVPYGWNVKHSIGRPLSEKIIAALHNRLFPRVAFPLLRSQVLNRPGAGALPTWCAPGFRRALRQADAVISTGGHHLTSITAPDCIYPQTFDYAMALKEAKPLYLWSQSIGPCHFSQPANKALASRILEAASAIYVRDEQSLEHLKAMQTPMAKVRKTFESVFMLEDSISPTRPPTTIRRMGVAIYAVKRRTPEELQEYVRIIRSACALGISQGFKIVFFPMDLFGHDHDILRGIMAGLAAGTFEVSWEYEGIPERFKRVRECDVFVGHKTHSVVFALLCGTPVVALAYHPKTLDFMTQFGLSEFCVSEADLSQETVCGTLSRILPVLDAVGAQQRKVASSLGKKARGDFQEMIAGIQASSGKP